jgi:hypothetical protein
MGVADDSSTELSELKSAITNASSVYDVDERFILAVVLQESGGCVRVWSTNNGVYNPGLMQSCNGKGTCNNGVSQNGDVQNPCPDSEIVQMIQDGVDGTDGGSCAGLLQCIEQAGTTGVSEYYRAARIYNSGSIASSGNLDDANGATACYSVDIANRLTGWVNANSCCDASTGKDSC